MNDHNEALDRLRATNPVPATELIDPDEISTVAAVCEERRLTPNAEPIPEPLHAPRRTLLRPALVFASAFLAVIVAAGLFALLGRGNGPVADEPPPATTVAAPTTTAPPTPSTTVAADPWGSAPVWIHDTAVGADGRIWVATNAGLVRWLPDTDEPVVYTTDNGLPFDDVRSIAVGPDGAVWVGGDGWIARSAGDEESGWTVHTAEYSRGPIAVAPDGAVWSVAGLDQLSRFDGSGWETFTAPELPGNDDPWSYSLAVAPNGTVWAGANDHRGVVSFDGSEFTYYEMFDGVPDQSAATVAIAPDGTVWIGGDIAGDDPGTGVVSFDGTDWTPYTTDDGLLSDAARVAVGPDGTVWAIHYGAGVAGVSRFEGDSWTAYPDVPAPRFPAAVDATGTLWMPAADHGSIISFNGIEPTALALPTLEPPEAPTSVSSRPLGTLPGAAQVIGKWDPILTEAQAGTTPSVATCPAGSSPNTPGPVDQKRPQPDEYSNQAADFDRVWGRIVYLDPRRHTWTFDVCTNTWHEMNAEGVLSGGGSLVYDVDSDRSVLFGQASIWVYDRRANVWEHRRALESDSHGWATLSAFYDPLSGLIVTNGDAEGDEEATHTFSAYDVDTDEWTTVGSVAFEDYWPAIVGYSHEADRIVTAGVFSGFGTHLINPRSGEVELVEKAHPEFVGGFGYSELVNGAPTAYAVALGPEDFDAVCGFDAQALDWHCLPNDEASRGHFGAYDGITYDWINDRLVFIGGAIHPWGDGEITYFDDIWSLDPETGEWFELLAPSS